MQGKTEAQVIEEFEKAGKLPEDYMPLVPHKVLMETNLPILF